MCGLFYFPDEFRLEEAIYLFTHRPGLLRIVAAHRLLDGLCVRKNLQFMLGEFPGDAWHICAGGSISMLVLSLMWWSSS
jgi:hypothetical protein